MKRGQEREGKLFLPPSLPQTLLFTNEFSGDLRPVLCVINSGHVVLSCCGHENSDVQVGAQLRWGRKECADSECRHCQSPDRTELSFGTEIRDKLRPLSIR